MAESTNSTPAYYDPQAYGSAAGDTMSGLANILTSLGGNQVNPAPTAGESGSPQVLFMGGPGENSNNSPNSKEWVLYILVAIIVMAFLGGLVYVLINSKK